MLLYSLDTDMASFVMKRSNLNAVERLRALPTDATCISTIVESELRYGIAVFPRRRQDREALDEFLG